MKLKWKSWWSALQKRNHLVVKLGVSILLVGLVFRLLLSRSGGFADVPDGTPFTEKISDPEPPVAVVAPEISDQIAEQGAFISDSNSTHPNSNAEKWDQNNDGKCDIFTGDWIPNPTGPVYTNETCDFIEGHQNCMMNGRPDTGYQYWRWSPRDCDLPQLNPKRFLELMRNKTWALIGDSISRNHVQSLLCILSKVEEAVQVYHDEEYKSRRWLFPSHNFTISVMWSPFLADAAIYEDYNGVSTHEIELQLDKLDSNWTTVYQNFDYIIFSSGKWYIKAAIYYENATVLGCHYCPGKNITQIGFDFAYRKVLSNVFDFITNSNHKGMIFYRTSTPDHFENGEWFNGGSCTRTQPAKEGEFGLSEVNKVLRRAELEEFEKAAVKASEKGVNLKLFDVTLLSLLRPDGHPGPYRHFYPFANGTDVKVINDCLHWCLPGPIDSWNDLLMEMVLNG